MDKVNYNQLMFGALLKFKCIDNIDLLMIMRMIGIENIDNSEEYCSSKYIKCFDNVRLSFDWDKISEDYTSDMEFESKVERFCGNKTKEIFDNLDISLLTLMKFKFYGFVDLNDIAKIFNSLQVCEIENLIKNRYLLDCFDGLSVCEESRGIKITKKGELRVFLIDNHIHVEYFKKLLIDNGYNDLLLDAFLITQDLDNGSVVEIFRLDKFLDFCDNFDICPYKNAVGEQGYSRSRVLEKK